ncbi:P-loop NTPase [Ectothiorhodospira mobilis]|uniref:nucleotide-binding protein n=1 Tax=Ectothiorhodospira mobilis TaxID=195064 RepID=UPI001EE7BA74|nr:ATP-binding protein [Ectothiorhodospira mobilis]MCG5535234.1 ATP-binding protein [Ectothiorhodospira mobilis]
MRVAIASGKGGTGKTTVSVNLADLLARHRPVVLTDLDVEEPNSGLFVQAETVHEEAVHRMVPSWVADQCTFCGVCQEVCQFNALIETGSEVMVFRELCHSCYACSELCPVEALPMTPMKIGDLSHRRSGSLDLVQGCLDIGQEQAVPLIAHSLDYLGARFSRDTLILCDAPPGTACSMIEAVKDADFVLLVTEPTPFGLHDLKLAVETVRGLGRPCAVVINRHGLGNADVEAYCRQEGIPVAARLPHSREAAQCYARGQLIHPHVPEVAAQLEAVAGFIQRIEQEGAA